MSVVIVDTGLGNVAAVQNMLTWVGISSERSTAPSSDHDTDVRYLLPGVGSFDEGVRRLRKTGWFSFLKERPPETPILGICLGMQLLGLHSEEGNLEGLGRLDVSFKKFSSVPRVPHMGWNEVTWSNACALAGPTRDRFYFTHSYAGECVDPDQVLGTTVYGEQFDSACMKANTIGLQFHAEKSHSFGKALLRSWYSNLC